AMDHGWRGRRPGGQRARGVRGQLLSPVRGDGLVERRPGGGRRVDRSAPGAAGGRAGRGPGVAVAAGRTRPVRRPGRRLMAEVVAEMVANVWKVVVAAGDAVAAGDPLVILESMKMEIPVESPLEGTVKELRVEEGGLVQE